MTQEQINEYLWGDNPFKISKELLSAVLGSEVTNIEKGCIEKEIKVTAYFDDARQRFHLNIHELAHKCKEWACIQGYDCLSDTTIIGRCNSHLFKSGQFMNKSVCLESFLGNTECESIFIACEWILDNEYS